MKLLDYIKTQKQLTDTTIRDFFESQIEAYREDQEFLDTVTQVQNFVLRGGKRARPMLVRLAYQITNREININIIKASAAVELIHEYILIHDDIADRDYQRYGGPTLELTFANLFSQRFSKTNPHFGTSMAMIAGDLLETFAYDLLWSTELNTEVKAQFQRKLNKTLQEVVQGWHIHQWQNHQPLSQASRQRYLKGMQLVSASYTFQAPLELGLILAEDAVPYRQTLDTYGYHVGMAFQIQDDILGVFGDSKATGKPVGNDLREGKKTLLVLDAYENSDASSKKMLENLLGKSEISDQEISTLQDIITESGALELSKQKAKEHISLGTAALADLPDTEQNDILTELAQFVLSRDH